MCAKIQRAKIHTSPCSSDNIVPYAFKRENENWYKTIMCTKVNKNWSTMCGKMQTVFQPCIS